MTDIVLPGSAVHPHVCGELYVNIGLSRLYNEFIPTSVGNSAWHKASGDEVTVHPHVCGELA